MEEIWKVLTFGMTPAQRALVGRKLWDILVAVHIALACGWLSVSGFPGFARATDVIELKQNQVKAAVEVLEQRIFDTRVRQCQAGTEDARRFYAEKIQELMSRYKELTHGEYGRMPDCKEL